MEAITQQARDEMLATYQRIRQIGLRLNSTLVKSLDREAIYEAGRNLGILKGNTLHFDSEDTTSVLMDYAIRHIRRGGVNAIHRYLQHSPPPSDSVEMQWLQAAAQAWYSIFQVEKVYPNFGLEVHDTLRDQTVLLIDIGFSQTALRHFILASHVYQMDRFWMTTGAALPMTADTLEALAPELQKRFGGTPQDYRSLSSDRMTELATFVVRTCLRAGMSERVAYTGPNFRRDSGSTPSQHTGKTGRNDPCPCGSGRKFKNCCLRRG
jgi:hypothetical protein